MHVDLESSHFISVICKLGLFRVSCIPWTYYCFILFLVCWLQFLHFVFSLRKSVFSLTCPHRGLSTELCIWVTRFSISSIFYCPFHSAFLSLLNFSFMSCSSFFTSSSCSYSQPGTNFLLWTHSWYICVYDHSFEFLPMTSSFSLQMPSLQS